MMRKANDENEEEKKDSVKSRKRSFYFNSPQIMFSLVSHGNQINKVLHDEIKVPHQLPQKLFFFQQNPINLGNLGK